jgi:hypothetical protein
MYLKEIPGAGKRFPTVGRTERQSLASRNKLEPFIHSESGLSGLPWPASRNQFIPCG